jgi:hypothetical protein
LPVPLSAPTDRRSEGSRDQAIDEGAVALIAMILEPAGMDGVGAEVLLNDPMILAFDHAPAPVNALATPQTRHTRATP